MKPVLYILMRSDMNSLNPGKAMAQAAHAASMFHKEMTGNQREYTTIYQKWLKETDSGFGTTIVLDAFSENNINKEFDKISRESFSNIGFHFKGIVFDPTYPVTDGFVTHYVPIVTCGYIFVDSERYYIDFPLYK